ncbi:hypothetical protein AB0F88_39635 [Streptosporangium sp. NPDC023963]|uniref:hypothetical protein n=1 Tax=Streptosporangium sp. NPDC023963 TaxID=3155608 RepID=UPI00342CF821
MNLADLADLAIAGHRRRRRATLTLVTRTGTTYRMPQALPGPPRGGTHPSRSAGTGA